MLSKPVIDEIARLLAERRLTQREIAAKLRVSRGVVGAIATGRRGLHGRRARSEDFNRDTTPPGRCSTCGGWVYLPCVACSAQAYRTRQRLLASVLPNENQAAVSLCIVAAKVGQPDCNPATKVA